MLPTEKVKIMNLTTLLTIEHGKSYGKLTIHPFRVTERGLEGNGEDQPTKERPT